MNQATLKPNTQNDEHKKELKKNYKEEIDIIFFSTINIFESLGVLSPFPKILWFGTQNNDSKGGKTKIKPREINHSLLGEIISQFSI